MKKILIVEDERESAEFLKHTLERSNYEVTIVGNGIEALVKIKDFKPDLILLDVVMPLMDGWQLLKKLRESPLTNNLKVIMCTARTLMKEIEKAGEMGVQGYILKPFEPHRVLKKIEEVLST